MEHTSAHIPWIPLDIFGYLWNMFVVRIFEQSLEIVWLGAGGSLQSLVWQNYRYMLLRLQIFHDISNAFLMFIHV